jgi:hypothetical protein
VDEFLLDKPFFGTPIWDPDLGTYYSIWGPKFVDEFLFNFFKIWG